MLSPIQRQIYQLVEENLPQLTTHELIVEMALKGSIRHIKANHEMMPYGSRFEGMPIILEGAMKVIRPLDEYKEILMYYIYAGETCAASFSCCRRQKKSEIRGVALMDTTILSIPVEVLDDWVAQYPEWRDFIFVAYEQRFSELIYTLDAVAFMSLEERLEEYLFRLKRMANNGEIRITHQEIAQDLYSSREAISRSLKKLEQKGNITLKRNRILFNA